MSDVSYRYAEKVLQGRRAIQNDDTGEVTFVANEGSVPADVPVTEEEDEAFKAVGMSIAAEEQFVQDAKPVKPTSRKSRKVTEGDK